MNEEKGVEGHSSLCWTVPVPRKARCDFLREMACQVDHSKKDTFWLFKSHVGVTQRDADACWPQNCVFRDDMLDMCFFTISKVDALLRAGDDLYR